MSASAGRIGQLLTRTALARPAGVAYAMCAFGIAAFWPTFVGLARVWRESADYNHGPVIALIAVIWLVRLRRRVDSLPVQPMRAALPVLAIAIVAWLIAYRGNSEMLQQLAAPAAIVLAILAALGIQVTRQVALPIIYFYFAIPIWDQLLPVLQAATTNVAEGVLRWMQVPTTVASHTVTIPEGSFVIVEGCSGKRYLLVGLAFAALLAASHGLRAKRAAVLLTAAAGLSLLVNWVRVIVIIYAGHVSNMEHYLVAQEHITFGWLMFLPLLAALIFIARALGRGTPPAEPPARADEADAGRVAWALPVACLFAPVLAAATQPHAGSTSAGLGQLPLMVGEWQGPLPGDTAWQPRFVAPEDERKAAYSARDGAVQLYVNVYGAQTQGHELIYFSNSVVPAERWSVAQSLPERDSMVSVIAVDNAGNRWVVAWTYSVNGRLITSATVAQLYYGMSALWRPVPSGAIALAAACGSDCAHAEERVRRFWRDHGQAIANVIPKTLT